MTSRPEREVPTPETDALVFWHHYESQNDGPCEVVVADHARKLEGQRDSVLAQLAALRVNTEILAIAKRMTTTSSWEHFGVTEANEWDDAALKCARELLRIGSIRSLDLGDMGAEIGRDAERYQWLRDNVEYIGETRTWDEVVAYDKQGRKVLESKQETFWTFSITDDWRLCMTQDEKPNLDAAIDAALAAGKK